VPPTDAVVIDPGDQVVDLGPLDEQERIRLEAEVDPPGAPQAGFGGASTSPGPSVSWLTAAGVLVVLAGGGTFALWRRRRSA
jgi:LPXTG-motif cell wall-anchored protein